MGITFSTHLRHSGFALQLHPFLRPQPFATLQIPRTTFALEFAISLIEIESEKDVIIVYYFEICHVWPIDRKIIEHFGFEWLIRIFLY